MKKNLCIILALALVLPMLMGCQSTAQPAVPATSETDIITAEQAKELALSHAGFTSDQVTGLRGERDLDERIPHYDVDFRQGGYEYDYEIHAQTGEVLRSEKEWD